MRKELSIILVNKISEVSRLGNMIDSFCAENNIPEKIANEFNLSLDEVLTNIISYGYDDNAEHTIVVDLEKDDDYMKAVVADDALEFNPLHVPDADITADLESRDIGGLGLHIVRKIMDSVDYQYKNNKNILTLIKHIKRS